jgi:hypothetical protein
MKQEASAMPEHQEIEWKESWRDEHLKWLCGYANAHGGMFFITCFSISTC